MGTKKIQRLRYRNFKGETILQFGPFDSVGFNRIMPGVSPSRAVVITDETVDKLWGDAVRNWLGEREIMSVLIPPRESAKDLAYTEDVYQHLYDFKTEKNTPIIALGGGFVSDVAGFVAGTYLRGLPYLVIPTTLLAQVDASIGGKCGLNFSGSKNMIGTFYHPKQVLIDLHFLNSLKRRDLNSGLAEVVKCAALCGPRALSDCLRQILVFREKGVHAFQQQVIQAVRCKIRMVRADEFDELGKRALLNFGHTVGHALESAHELNGLTHGEAVGLGMLAAAHLAKKICGAQEEYFQRLHALLSTLGLPVSFAKINIKKTMSFLKKDKKIINSKINMLLPDRKGTIKLVKDVPANDIESTLTDLKKQKLNI